MFLITTSSTVFVESALLSTRSSVESALLSTRSSVESALLSSMHYAWIKLIFTTGSIPYHYQNGLDDHSSFFI